MIAFCGNCRNHWGLIENPLCMTCDKSGAVPTNWMEDEDLMQASIQAVRDQMARAKEVGDQEAKADAGKLELDLVPLAIMEDIAEVRMYGNRKYGSSDNWKTVEMRRYINALLRHLVAFLRDHNSVDEESGILHYKHMECNMAFISEMMKEEKHG